MVLIKMVGGRGQKYIVNWNNIVMYLMISSNYQTTRVLSCPTTNSFKRTSLAIDMNSMQGTSTLLENWHSMTMSFNNYGPDSVM
jgi:hypothetical protein